MQGVADVSPFEFFYTYHESIFWIIIYTYKDF